jgi:hypothetical protein
MRGTGSYKSRAVAGVTAVAPPLVQEDQTDEASLPNPLAGGCLVTGRNGVLRITYRIPTAKQAMLMPAKVAMKIGRLAF